MAATPGTVERRVVHLTGRAALTIVGTIVGLIVARGVFVAAHRPLSWGVACAVAAVLLDPVVDRLAVHIKRVPAVLLTFLAIGAIGVGTAYLVFDGVQQAVDRLETAAPEAAQRIEERDGRVGNLASDFQLTHRVTSFVDNLGERVTGGGDVLRSTAGTAPSYLVCAILTLFLMTYGPRMAMAALEQDPDEARRRRVKEVMGPAVAQARSGILLTGALGFVVGLLAAGAARLLELPAPAALGLTAGVLALLPHVGIVLGSVPLLLLTLGFQSSQTTILVALGVVGAQVVDSAWVRTWISDRAVEIGLLVPFVVALLGYEVYGVGGAAYGLAFAILGLAVLDQLERRNDERIARGRRARRAAARAARRSARGSTATAAASGGSGSRTSAAGAGASASASPGPDTTAASGTTGTKGTPAQRTTAAKRTTGAKRTTAAKRTTGAKRTATPTSTAKRTAGTKAAAAKRTSGTTTASGTTGTKRAATKRATGTTTAAATRSSAKRASSGSGAGRRRATG